MTHLHHFGLGGSLPQGLQQGQLDIAIILVITCQRHNIAHSHLQPAQFHNPAPR